MGTQENDTGGAGHSGEVIVDTADFQAFVDRTKDADYAIDTEFHRERSYFPKVALIQINNGSEIVLIDPLAVDPEPLAERLLSDGVAVLHAASQDLEVFQHWAGVIPNQIFDTQLAAGFTGLSTPSLAALHDRVLQLSLPKTSRLTDWLARPLTSDQLDYAASDVLHLLELRDRLAADLESRGRLQWAQDEFEAMRVTPRGQREPEDAWRRIKAVRQLKGASLGAARLLAAWRERKAAEVDQPVRFILSDLALVGIAQRRPKNVDQLRRYEVSTIASPAAAQGKEFSRWSWREKISRRSNDRTGPANNLVQIFAPASRSSQRGLLRFLASSRSTPPYSGRDQTSKLWCAAMKTPD